MTSSRKRAPTGRHRAQVSLVSTIRNEADNLPELLVSIEQQTLAPAEIIFVDGGSTDGSLQILDEWTGRLPLKVISRPGTNISTGRNIGISKVSTDYVAITDAGVQLAPDWLERLLAPLTQTLSSVDVSAGFFAPDERTEFEAALAASTLPDPGEIDPETFLPSSRSVAFRRSWFEAGVRYPEWLDYCEDLVFDLRLKTAGARFAFQPDAIVRFRPRQDIRSFGAQYFRYARGDGKAGLFARRHLVRYITYLLVIPSAIVLKSPYWRIMVLLGALGYMWRLVQRLWKRSEGNVPQTLRLTPLAACLRAFGDLAKMAGYPAGLIWRARRYGLRRDWRRIPDPMRD